LDCPCHHQCLAALGGYQISASKAFAAHGAKFLARGGDSEVVEGTPLERHVIIEFPDMAAARACDASPEHVSACIGQVNFVNGVPTYNNTSTYLGPIY
jgi:uncharacterized protein (DUF1330 family)